MANRKRPKKKGRGEPVMTRRTAPMTRVYIRDVNDRYSDYPSNGLTPQRLARIFRAADGGDVRSQMELFEEMEEKDTHLFSQMQTRKLAVTGLEWEVQPFSDEEADKAVAEFVSGQLSGIEELNDLFTDLLDAIGKGISIAEILWDIDDEGHNIIRSVEYVPSKKLLWDPSEEQILLCTKDCPQGIPIPENKFVVHRYRARSGHPSRAGVLRTVAWMYLFKNYNLKDWVSFCEVYGMPLRLGKYDISASEDDKRALMDAILSLGTDAAGIVPSTTAIEFIEANKTSSADVYESLAVYCDRQMSKAILGQTLTSDTGGGSRAQGVVHNDVRHDLTVADAKALAATLRRDLIRPLVEFNFGVGTNLPEIKFAYEEEEDLKQAAEICRTLVCDIGLPIPQQYLYSRFNIPKPEDGEAVARGTVKTWPMADPAEETLYKSGLAEQDHIDRMVETANQKGGELMAKMLEPILHLARNAEDLTELQEKLSHKEELAKLYEAMDTPEFDDLLEQGIYLSTLIGRSMQT